MSLKLLRTLLLIGCLAAVSGCGKPPSEDSASTQALINQAVSTGVLSPTQIRQLVNQAAIKQPTLTTTPRLTAEERLVIAGADADGNGIRDDLDRLLRKASRITERQRLALAQSFRASQRALLVDLSNEEEITSARVEMLEGWQCVADNFGFNDQKPGIIQFVATLEAQQNDTPERKNRYDSLGCESLKVLLVDAASRARLSPKPCTA